MPTIEQVIEKIKHDIEKHSDKANNIIKTNFNYKKLLSDLESVQRTQNELIRMLKLYSEELCIENIDEIRFKTEQLLSKIKDDK